MKKLLLTLCLTIFSGVLVSAQTSSSDYRKSEFYVGYSNQQVDTGLNSDSGNAANDFFNNRLSFNGFEASGVYNVSRYVGIKGDVSGAYRSKNFSFTDTSVTPNNSVNFKTRNSLYNFLGGVQIKDNSSDARVKPFAHALVGVAHARTRVKDVTCSNTFATTCANLAGSFSDTGLAGAFGGGIDIKLSDKIDLRAIQADYNPIRIGGQTDHNFRFGIGFVFK